MQFGLLRHVAELAWEVVVPVPMRLLLPSPWEGPRWPEIRKALVLASTQGQMDPPGRPVRCAAPLARWAAGVISMHSLPQTGTRNGMNLLRPVTNGELFRLYIKRAGYWSRMPPDGTVGGML